MPQPRAARPERPPLVYLLSGFAGLIALGTLLLLLPFATETGRSAGLMTALFTATSAVCVTGLVVVDTRDYWSGFGEAVILVLIQLGGLGFMTTATVLLLLFRRRLSLRQRLVARQQLGRLGTNRVSVVVRRVVLFTLALEAAGALLLVPLFAIDDGGMSLDAAWRGLFTAVSAFNNAGFDLEGGFTSLVGHSGDTWLLGAVAVLTFVGAGGFAVWSDVVLRRSWHRLAVDTKIVLVTTPLLILIGVLVLLVELLPGGALARFPLGEAFAAIVVESVYTRTSGFTSLSIGALQGEVLFALAGLMFIGGAAGSTAGGIKVNTFATLFFAILAAVRGKEHVTAFERELPARQINLALSVALLGVALVFAVAFLLALGTDAEFHAVFFEAVSAFATCGLSTGITRELSDGGQLLLALTMYVGRLGPLTIALALAGRPDLPDPYRWAEEDVSIG